jgi:ubiquinone/menaquinone biosynthesis C-methylase UbiE
MAMGYAAVTELPGNKITSEQLARLYQRYRFAQQFCKEKEVMEVACGAGMGLGYLAKVAKKVIGGDIDKEILKYALKHYEGRDKIGIREFDAQNLPFEDKSFDAVILYEAIYYLPEPEKFVSEAHRVLRDDGVLLICTANKDWADFNPSPYSTKYFSAQELYSLLKRKFTKVKVLGAFPVSEGGIKNKIVSLIKRTAVTLHLIPKTMKGKEIFKRLFFGKLLTLPPEIEDGQVEYSPPVAISSDQPNYQHKVLFFEAHA